MTKETLDKNLTWKMIILASSILFALGGYFTTFNNNSKRLDKVEVLASSNEKAIIKMQENIIYIRESVDIIRKEFKN